ncbi:lia operon protein LiaF [Oikeobacillus pervagus]|uniref:Lia operon protein LiaF n=1 Tax=Oikeobacillus pervagus TaxID=1325931 RepID=A0AAJ1T1Q9_9BACI|nr:cell wall-active antibiotics response protein LiaF [Oikeobacillus pervagus]MDQ0214344.1 lia operon protein LiaF [Oikeobacillus pervagus]
MRNQSKWVQWLFLVAGCGLLLELTFERFFPLLFSVAAILIGYKTKDKIFGNALFIIGIILTIMVIFATFSFRVLLVFLLIYWFYHYVYEKNTHSDENTNQGMDHRNIIRKRPYFSNFQRTFTHDDEQEAFELQDINSFFNFSDIFIDLRMAYIPQGEAVIIIRGISGNIQLLIPYDIEVSIHHSAVIGKATIFKQEEKKIWNQNMIYQTEQYENASRKVKILTSVVIGDLEVRNV